MNVTRVEQELHTAICQYTNAREAGKSGAEESHSIKDAITALDRAAYEQGCSSADEDKWRLQTALDRERNIVGPLRRNLAETRTLRCQDTRQLVLRDEEIERLKEDSSELYKSLGNIATQRDVAREELAEARATISRLRCAAKED